MRDIVLNKHKLENPDWYLYFQPQLAEYFYEYEKNNITEEFLNKRELIVKTLITAIKENTLLLGKNGENFDSERKPIDTIIVHMTSTSYKKNRDLDYLNVLDLIRLYASEYSRKNTPHYGKPIFSGHYYNGVQTFIPYHYLINPDGSFINILKDEYIGWHAGNWDINCRSIAIAFKGNFTNSFPSNAALKSAKNIITKYKNVKVLGHKEIIQTTKCPGDKFDDWRKSLI
jgi:hypothetical protein